MKSISGKKLCKIVENKGWILKKITGSHHIYEKPDESKIISIPVQSRFKTWNFKINHEDS